MKRKLLLALAPTIPFMLWFAPWLAVILSGHPCDPGPPQPTWQCRALELSNTNSILSLPVFVGALYAPIDPNNTIGFVAWMFLYDYVIWGCVGYCFLLLFRSIRVRIAN
jgi:hypothetical protein